MTRTGRGVVSERIGSQEQVRVTIALANNSIRLPRGLLDIFHSVVIVLVDEESSRILLRFVCLQITS